MSTTGGSDTVTNKQLYDELVAMRSYFDDKFEGKADTSATDDHEGRLRSLERFRYAIPSAAIVAACAAVGTLVYYLASPLPH